MQAAHPPVSCSSSAKENSCKTAHSPSIPEQGGRFFEKEPFATARDSALPGKTGWRNRPYPLVMLISGKYNEYFFVILRRKRYSSPFAG
jgi:hypothetical protein